MVTKGNCPLKHSWFSYIALLWGLEKGSIVPTCIQFKETELAEGTWKIAELQTMGFLQLSKAAVVCLAGKTSGARKFPLQYITFTGTAALPSSLLAFTHEPAPSFLLSAHCWTAEALAAPFPVKSQRGGSNTREGWGRSSRFSGALFGLRLLLALCFGFYISWISSLVCLSSPGDPSRKRRTFHLAIHTWRIIFLFSLIFVLCHDTDRLFLSFPSNFLAMFVCLFEFWFFFQLISLVDLIHFLSTMSMKNPPTFCSSRHTCKYRLLC